MFRCYIKCIYNNITTLAIVIEYLTGQLDGMQNVRNVNPGRARTPERVDGGGGVFARLVTGGTKPIHCRRQLSS